jgi:hypothetical protein
LQLSKLYIRLRDLEGGRSNEVDAELKQMVAAREAVAPAPVDLPEDLPALYRNFVDDLVSTLSEEEVAGRASDELHRLVDRVVVRHEAKVGHTVEILGELASMLGAADSKNAAIYEAAACSLKLVAGARNTRCRTRMACRI